MTTLTKIFVVLVCLFAFIFTPLAISFAARAHNWKQAANDLLDRVETAKANERSTLATAASAIAHHQGLLREERNRVENLQQQISKMELEIEKLTRERDGLEASRNSWQNSAERLTAELEAINNQNEALTKENQRLTKSELALLTKTSELNDWVAEQDAKVVMLSQQLAKAQEELAHFRKENDELRQSLALGRSGEPHVLSPTPGVSAVGPSAPMSIRGTVTDVKRQHGLASVDVGSSSGVSEGMVMVVIRGNDYICDLVATRDITPSEAVCSIRTEGGKQIRAGDVVIDERSFLAQ